jgi:cytochrome c oxidase cbb3-type subunit III
VLLAALGAALVWRGQVRLADRLLRIPPALVIADPDLRHSAVSMGRPLYARHCASCHGANLQGSAAHGVPNLAASAWLYGNDAIEVERTILYGIRSGHPKARNITDMPPLVRTGQISPGDARDVVEFLGKLSGGTYDEPMAARGRTIYYDKGNCYDCHADDARGVIDYGTPSLVGPVWLYGGDRNTLYDSIVNGRHGICPAWVNTLAPVQIRALSVFLVTTAGAAAHPEVGTTHAGSG